MIYPCPESCFFAASGKTLCKKIAQIIFYFEEKQYLCNPKQTITHFILQCYHI